MVNIPKLMVPHQLYSKCLRLQCNIDLTISLYFDHFHNDDLYLPSIFFIHTFSTSSLLSLSSVLSMYNVCVG